MRITCIALILLSGGLEVSNASCASSPPSNDDACNAISMTLGVPVPFNNTCATKQTNEISPGAANVDNPLPVSNPIGGSCAQQNGWCFFEAEVQNSVWYTFEAPASGCVSIETDNVDTTDDLQLAVYEVEDCNDFVTFKKRAANDDKADNRIVLLPKIDTLACLTPGTTYYVQLDGFNGAGFSANIITTECGLDPLSIELEGGCQNRLTETVLGVDPTTNYLKATVTGGLGLLQGFAPICTWRVESGDSGSIEYTDGCNAAVAPSVTTTYCAMATEYTGCSVEECITINALDAAAIDCTTGNGQTKYLVCHAPPGNPTNVQEICIGEPAVNDHLTNHPQDSLGPCTCRDTNPPFPEPPSCVDLKLTLIICDPQNPFDCDFDIIGLHGFEVRDLTTNIVLLSETPTSNFWSDNSPIGPWEQTSTCVDPRNCYRFTIDDQQQPPKGIVSDTGYVGGYSIEFGGTTTTNTFNPQVWSTQTFSVGGSCSTPTRSLFNLRGEGQVNHNDE